MEYIFIIDYKIYFEGTLIELSTLQNLQLNEVGIIYCNFTNSYNYAKLILNNINGVLIFTSLENYLSSNDVKIFMYNEYYFIYNCGNIGLASSSDDAIDLKQLFHHREPKTDINITIIYEYFIKYFYYIYAIIMLFIIYKICSYNIYKPNIQNKYYILSKCKLI